jgi:hypothetical protein
MTDVRGDILDGDVSARETRQKKTNKGQFTRMATVYIRDFYCNLETTLVDGFERHICNGASGGGGLSTNNVHFLLPD